MDTLENTFAGWAGAGRTVRRGEQARFFLVDPDDPAAPGVALFALDQTDEREELNTAGYERVPADEYKRRRAEARGTAKRGPKAKCSWHPESRLMKVWIGSHPEAIKGLRAGGWLFDLGSHRWRKSNVDPIEVAQKLARLGLEVEAEGFYFAPAPDVTREAI